jgi:hypothetical protein
MKPSAIRAAFSDWKLIRTRQVVQLVFEVPLADADAAYDVLGGMPDSARERWFAIAPLAPSTPTAKEEHSAASIARLQPEEKPAGAKRTWEEFQPPQQAGIRCGDIKFAIFLEEEYPEHWSEFQDCADCVRSICAVHSRSELGSDQRARILWTQLDKHFQAWDAKVRMNA